MRLAAFSCEAPAASSYRRDLLPRSEVRRTAWGLELEAWGHDEAKIRQVGPEAVCEALAHLAASLGLEPIFVAPEVDLRRMPSDVVAQLGAAERTFECRTCGAPVGLRLVVGCEATSCPYCRAPVAIPVELAAEVEHHRRRMRVHDVFRQLDAARLNQTWTSVGPRSDHPQLACAVCGAPSAHQPGILDAQCQSCGATIVPSAEQLDRDVQSARRDVDRLAARRLAQAQGIEAMQASFATWYPVMIVGSALLLMGGPIAAGLVVNYQHSHNPLLLIVFVIVLAVLAALAGS